VPEGVNASMLGMQ